MRPAPEIRSRNPNHSGSSNGLDTNSSSSSSSSSSESVQKLKLSNGSLKGAVVTRSKSVKLRLRRRSDRSPLKAHSPAKLNSADVSNSSSNGSFVRKRDKDCGTSGHGGTRGENSSSNNPKYQGENGVSKTTSKGLYARHYKSYRRSSLSSSIKMRERLSGDGGDRKFSSRRHLHHSNNNCQRSLGSRRLRTYSNQGLNRSPISSLRSGISYKKNRSSSAIENNRRKLGSLLRKTGSPKKLISSNSSSSTTSTPLSSPTCLHLNSHSDTNGTHKDKGAKRRSALWVLNCEAEEFLFGETAADKHELELPPNRLDSPPPKKRRRWRETELSHLLETSPFLESKLRNSSSSSDSGRESFNASPPPKRKRKVEFRGGRPAVKTKKPQLGADNVPPVKCSSSKPVSSFKLDGLPVISNFELLSPTSSIRSTFSSLGEPPPDMKTVQLRQLLSSIPWRFSFEDPPKDESWYSTFSRSEDAIIPFMSFLSTSLEPVVLPYEMDKLLKRSRGKLPKNSRKSPRCHASTLAILSSEKPTRSTRNSLNAESGTAISPPAPVVALPPNATIDSVLSSTQTPPVRSISPAQPSTTKSSRSPMSKFMNDNGMSMNFKRSLNPINGFDHPRTRKQGLSAQQYLWDAIQFLSDPYVVSLLAGDEPDTDLPLSPNPANIKTRSRHNSSYNTSSNNNNNSAIPCPVKKLVQNFEALERKASLRSCDGSNAPGASSSGKESGTQTNSNSGGKVTPPKYSPRNHSHGTNNVNGTSVVNNSCSSSSIRLLGVNGISKSVDSRSPPTGRKVQTSKSSNHPSCKYSKVHKSSVHSSTSKSTGSKKSGFQCPISAENGTSMHARRRNKISSRSSPVVMVSDIFKTGASKAKTIILEEELLFLGDGLPPLPSWPM